MASVLTLFGIILLAYLGGIWAFRVKRFSARLQPFFIIGIEFLILGILLGPYVTGLVTDKTLEVLRPLISILIGWIGLVFGLQFNFREMRVLSRSNYIIAIVQAAFTFVIVCILFIYLLHWTVYPEVTLKSLFPLVVTLGAAASVSSPAVIAAISHHMRADGIASRLLRYVSSIDGIFGIVAFGFLVPFFHLHYQIFGFELLNPWQWFLFSIFLSLTIGFLFHMLTLSKPSDAELLAMLIGILVFTAGACYFLNLSSLFVCFLVGLILANLSTNRERFYRILVLKEKPIYILLLVLAGSLYQVVPATGVILGAVYVCIRLFGKIVGNTVALSFYKGLFNHPTKLGVGLISQGAIALAIGIDYYFIYQDWSAKVLISILVTAIFINALLGPAILERLFIREGEV